MRLQELIGHLIQLINDYPELAEAPVMMAQQPRWPLQTGIGVPCVVVDQDSQEGEATVYLPEHHFSSQYEGRERSPYAPRAAFDGGDEEFQ